MRARTRKRFLRASEIFAALTVLFWVLQPDVEWRIIPMFFLPVTALTLFAIWLCSTPTSPYQAPDILGERFSPDACFDIEGLCFLHRFDVAEGMFWLEIYYQNRFTGPCSAAFDVAPMEGFPPMHVSFECEAGEVGVIRQPWAVPRDRQGTIMIFDVYAKATYPLGRGEMIRPELAERRLGAGGNETAKMAVAAAMLMVGHVHLPAGPRGGKVELRLPENVAETIPPEIQQRREILWRIDPATEALIA
jgi:hypothetical protein